MIYDFDRKQKKAIAYTSVIGILLVAAILGGATGFGGSYLFGSSSSTTSSTSANGVVENVATATASGLKDKKAFPDEATGTLKEGGLEGEGSFHLERPGGKSQNVYLTSTTVDLSLFLNKKVSVWGQTFEGEKAGWLMDVGYIEVKK